MDTTETPAGANALLLVNTGSPEAPEPEALARYLAEFLGDRRIVEMHPLLWLPILHGIVIPRRKAASAERYRQVWTAEGSPLVAATRATARAVAARLGGGWDVRWAMRYGTQKICDVLPGILAARPARLVVLPLFAQYATQTTAAVYDAVDAVLARAEDAPPVARIRDFHDEPAYIEALAAGVEAFWRERGPLGEAGKLVMSFHGVPVA
ncbi:MAG: ferrochelatase, partial [Duodenibacillus sp.]|nr:ferrochelatase [Duodenibacillus sp.]